MLKQLILIFLILVNYTINKAFAQTTGRESLSTEKNYKWGVGLQINAPEKQTLLQKQTNIASQIWSESNFFGGSQDINATTKDKTFATSITVSYYLKENIFLRGKASINKVDIEFSDEFGNSTVRNDHYVSIKRNDYSGAIGVGRSIAINHFIVYGGFEIPFTSYGKTQYYGLANSYDITTGALIASTESSITLFSAYSIGVGNFAGFAFMFKNFGVGGEISYAFLYNKATSASTEHEVYISSGGISTTDGTENRTISNFDFSKVKPSLMLTYSF